MCSLSDLLKIPGTALLCGRNYEISSAAYLGDMAELPSAVKADIIITEADFIRKTGTDAFFEALSAAGAKGLMIADVDPDNEEFKAASGYPITAASSEAPLRRAAESIAAVMWKLPECAAGDAYSKEERIADLVEAAGIQPLLAKLSGFASCGCAFKDNVKGRAFNFSAGREFAENIRTFPLNEIRRIYKTFPVEDNGFCCGWLIMEGEPMCSRSVIDAALLGLKFISKKTISALSAQSGLVTQFIDSLIHNEIRDQSELLYKLRAAGLHNDSACVSLVIEHSAKFDTAMENRLFILSENLKKCFAPFFSDICLHIRADSVTAFILLSAEALGKPQALRRELDKLNSMLASEIIRNTKNSFACCGAGRPVKSIMDFYQSYTQSIQAVVFAKIAKRANSLVHWEELGSFKVMMEISENKDAERFVRAMLAPLKEFDRAHNLQLEETLRALLDNGWGFQRAAGVLAYHQNTIKYRFKKVCELLGGNPAEDQALGFDVALALRLEDIYIYKNSKLPASAWQEQKKEAPDDERRP